MKYLTKIHYKVSDHVLHSGGGIAFQMAYKHPEMITAAFMLHSIPLNGLKAFDENGTPISAEDVAAMYADAWPNDMEHDAIFEQLKPFSTNPEGLPPPEHGIFAHLFEGEVKNRAISCACLVNNDFTNISPCHLRCQHAW